MFQYYTIGARSSTVWGSGVIYYIGKKMATAQSSVGKKGGERQFLRAFVSLSSVGGVE